MIDPRLSSKLLVSTLLLGITFAAVTLPSARAASVEEIALLNKPDRQKILVEGAKKEGKISWYTSLIVDQVVALARREGLGRLVLETGDRHPAAWTVYERAGFTRCGPVLDYPDSKWSVFYEKSLAA